MRFVVLVVLGLLISSVAAARDDARLRELTAQIQAEYKPVGKPVIGSLEDEKPLRLKVKKNYCYAWILKLQEGAAFSPCGLASFTLEIDPHVHYNNSSNDSESVGLMGCMDANGTLILDKKARGCPHGVTPGWDVGQGKFTVQFYQQAGDPKGIANQSTLNRLRLCSGPYGCRDLREWCRKCGRIADEDKYSKCLERRDYSPDDCDRGHTNTPLF